VDEPGGWSGVPQPTGVSSRFWPALAIVAIIVATAGWTTVVVMSMKDNGTAGPIATATDNSTLEPIAPSHEFPQLEALLPASVLGTAMDVESWTGDAFFADDPWSQTLITFLATVKKVPADVHMAQAYDAGGTLQVSAAAYQVDGIGSAALREAIIAATKALDPGLQTSEVTVGGRTVTKGLGSDLAANYWYAVGNVVLEVAAADEARATTVLAALPPGSAPSSPSPAPSGARSPTPSPTPSPS
jgi:hypothetical protein